MDNSGSLPTSRPTYVRIWPILCLGFGTLIALIALSGWLAYVRSKSTYSGVSRLYADEYELQKTLGAVRADIADSAVLVRDFLLDPTLSTNAATNQLKDLRASTGAQMNRLDHLVRTRQSAKLKDLRRQIEAYWASLEPALTGNARERAHTEYSFIHAEISPRRQAALRVLTEIEQLSLEAFNGRRKDVDAQNANFTFYLAASLSITPLIALAVALVSIYRNFYARTYRSLTARESARC